MINSRRDFIKSSGLVGLGFLGLNQLAANAATFGFVESFTDGKYGPLFYNQGDILSLPKGFSAKVISRKGDVMTDGLLTPGAYDGMGVFKWKKDKMFLIRNHELSPGAIASGPFGKNNEFLNKIDKNNIYDFDIKAFAVSPSAPNVLLLNAIYSPNISPTTKAIIVRNIILDITPLTCSSPCLTGIA